MEIRGLGVREEGGGLGTEEKGRAGKEKRRLDGGGEAIDQRDKRDESRSTVIRQSGETLDLTEPRGGEKTASMNENRKIQEQEMYFSIEALTRQMSQSKEGNIF